jgi:hypothetical protein
VGINFFLTAMCRQAICMARDLTYFRFLEELTTLLIDSQKLIAVTLSITQGALLIVIGTYYAHNKQTSLLMI